MLGDDDIPGLAMIIDKSELTSVVTSEYLHEQYLHLYCCIYGVGGKCRYIGNHGKLLAIVRPFIADLCSYLYTEVIPIESVTVGVHGLGIIIHLYVGSTHHIDIKLLEYEYLSPWFTTYSLIVYGRLYRAYGAHNLAMVLRGSLGKEYCSECHYSDEGTRYCGKGMEMYLIKCSGRVTNTTQD